MEVGDLIFFERTLNPRTYGLDLDMRQQQNQKLELWEWLGNNLADIDKIYIEDLMAANRQRAASDPDLSAEIAEVACLEPRPFYRMLASQWKKHHAFHEVKLQPYVVSLSQQFPLGITEVTTDVIDDNFVALFKEMLAVDYETLIASVAIKQHLGHWLTDIAGKEGRPIEAVIAELGYIPNYYDLLRLSAKTDFLSLVDLAHMGSVALRDIRVGKLRRAPHYADISDKTTADRTAVNRTSNLAYLRKTMTFDNMEEYLVVSNLEGLSGYVLWNIAMRVLNESGVAPNQGTIYSLTTEEIVSGLETLSMVNRTNRLELVRPLRQIADTCSVTSARMAMESISGHQLPESTHNYILKRSQASRDIGGQHFAGVALAIKELLPEADVEIIHTAEGRKRFHNGRGSDLAMPEDMFGRLSNKYYKLLRDAEKAGVHETIAPHLGTETVKDRLKEGRVVILAGQQPAGFLHAIFVYGYDPESDSFRVVDPLEGFESLKTTDQLLQFMTTNIGKWCITLGSVNG